RPYLPPCGGESDFSILASTPAGRHSLSARNRKRGDLSAMRQPVRPSHRGFARSMRAHATKAETMLWQALRNRQLNGLKFKRQVPLDGFILDFVCFEARLIIEVDGSQHADSQGDVVRDRHFEAHSFRILRFWNEEVERNLDAVCEAILQETKGRG
ncbi:MULTISPECIES: endonuclease domain-containing protein, partial [unclassified Mesorhizobium]